MKSLIADRAQALLEAEPKVIGFVRSGNHIVLTLSFRGCDDDAFEIEADLSTVRFWHPRGE